MSATSPARDRADVGERMEDLETRPPWTSVTTELLIQPVPTIGIRRRLDDFVTRRLRDFIEDVLGAGARRAPARYERVRECLREEGWNGHTEHRVELEFGAARRCIALSWSQPPSMMSIDRGR
jgi:hypothetical protein